MTVLVKSRESMPVLEKPREASRDEKVSKAETIEIKALEFVGQDMLFRELRPPGGALSDIRNERSYGNCSNNSYGNCSNNSYGNCSNNSYGNCSNGSYGSCS